MKLTKSIKYYSKEEWRSMRRKFKKNERWKWQKLNNARKQYMTIEVPE